MTPRTSGIMEYTHFEKTRIIGARALQIAMGAPVLVKADSVLDPIMTAKTEFENNVIPLTVKRRMPLKKE